MKIRRPVSAAVVVGLVGVGAACAPGGERVGKGDPVVARAVTYRSPEELPERRDADGTTIEVGNPKARSTVQVYEDPRCPVVEEFERTGATALQALLLEGKVRAKYTFASFKDDRLGGDGSKRAVNALRAASEKGMFVEYHAVLFAHQVDVESSGGFTTARLLELAREVPGLRDDAFDQAVKTMKYQSFVTASQRAYEHTGDDPIGPGTPTVIVNGHAIDGSLFAVNFDAKVFGLMVRDLQARPSAWELEYEPLKKRLDAAES
ncbi:thioredoxin domain-containing protein [Streptomyces sp. SID2563]|nr:thioredoxin domain-containing protein [Streptomyces sp. SID2563]MYW13708.1 thioredoxin domain-containing protein [Streptomyces sp. SID2563]